MNDGIKNATVHYMTPNQLSGTWLFNDILIGDAYLRQYNLNFKDKNDRYYYVMAYFPDNRLSVDDYSEEYGDSEFNFYDNGVWHNEAYRTITFDGTQTVSQEFYDWFIANATPTAAQKEYKVTVTETT